MNNSISNQAFIIDPSKFPVGHQYEVILPNKEPNITSYINDFSATCETEMLMDINAPALVAQADNNFNSLTNMLDILNLDNNKNVVVIPNTCPVFTQQFDLKEASVLLSPKSMSPHSNPDGDYQMIDIEVVEVPNHYYNSNKYTHTYAPLTPPLSPKMSVKEIVEKARVYVTKSRRGGNKRGRPAKKCDEDLNEKIQTEKDKKKARVQKNNLASRKYRRTQAERREKIDKKLADELDKFEQLKSEHMRLQREIECLQRMIDGIR